jgi:uncharacterized protein (TIGR00106 family)
MLQFLDREDASIAAMEWVANGVVIDDVQRAAYNQRRSGLQQCEQCALLSCWHQQVNRGWLRLMVLLEMSITPLGKGESVSQYVAECVKLVEESGLDYELHAMGTIVEGELPEVLDLMRRCIERVAEHSDRVTCAAKLDFRRGHSGRIRSKVESVEEKLKSKARRTS